MVAGHAGETDCNMSESETGRQTFVRVRLVPGLAIIDENTPESMSMVTILRSDLSICMHTRTCGMFVNIAPRDLFIQHPGNVVQTAGLPVHTPFVLKMVSQSHGNQSHSDKFPIAVLLHCLA